MGSYWERGFPSPERGWGWGWSASALVWAAAGTGAGLGEKRSRDNSECVTALTSHWQQPFHL